MMKTCAMKHESIVKKLRAICLALPNTTETLTLGHPTWQVALKTFCVFEEYKGIPSIAFKAEKVKQAEFLKEDRFYRTPYVGQHGWVSLKADRTVDWTEVKRFIDTSYELITPRRKKK
jgi:predicted DNA-binding protein (MmcQ/YjbR family)